MAFDLLTKKRSGKDWSCSIGEDLAPRARPPMKKYAAIGLAAGVAGAFGYLFWRDRQHTHAIHRRLPLPAHMR